MSSKLIEFSLSHWKPYLPDLTIYRYFDDFVPPKISYWFLKIKNLHHTYIIGHCNSSVRIMAELLTPLVLCSLIFYVSGVTYSLSSTPNDWFLRNYFMAGLFIFRIFARNLLGTCCRRNIFFIYPFFWKCLTWSHI